MRDLLKWVEPSALWALFFLTSGYGRVLRASVTDFWGWSAMLAWGLSCALWGLILSRHELRTANAISSLRYALTCVAAWAFLSEGVGWQRAAGMLLIGIGIVLVR